MQNIELVAEYVTENLMLKNEVSRDFVEHVLKLAKLFDSKMSDYGAGNISAFGELGVLVRVNDKIERLKNLQYKGTLPENESVDDSWNDISVYGVIAILLREGKWR